MKIQVIPVGPLATNCYLLGDEKTGECAIIDPGAQAERKIFPALEEFGMKCTKILLTHGHFDHVMALRDVKDKTGAEICIHKNDAPMLTEEYQSTWKALAARGYRQALADRMLEDGDTVQVGNLTVRVMLTPGHTQGSCVYLCEDVMFAGDTLFCGGCGRWDLDGGDADQMYDSLRRLAALEGDFRVFPGHEEATTLEHERQTNPVMTYAMKRCK